MDHQTTPFYVTETDYTAFSKTSLFLKFGV